MMVTFGSLVILFTPYFFIDGWDNMRSNQIMATTLWVMYFLLEGFYSGALTMFFVDEITIPFNSFKDVLQAYPEWNIVFGDGLETYIKVPADQVSFLFVYIFYANHLEGQLYLYIQGRQSVQKSGRSERAGKGISGFIRQVLPRTYF